MRYLVQWTKIREARDTDWGKKGFYKFFIHNQNTRDSNIEHNTEIMKIEE